MFWSAPDVRWDENSVKNFNASMIKYKAMLGKSLDETLIQWAGRASEEFMKESPPFVDKSASNSAEAKRRGERAAKDALIKSVTPASMMFESKYKSKALEKIVKRKQYGKWKDTTKNMPKLKNWEAVPFTEDLHREHRPAGRFDSMKATKRVTFDEAKWKRYLRKIQARVGFLKAGWAVCAQALGRKVPGWIARHLPYAEGYIRIDLKSPHKNILMQNSTPTVSRFSSRYNYALDWISKRMTKQMEFILEAEKRKLK